MPEREGERDNVYSWANEQVRECYQIEAFFFFLNKYLWKWWASLVAQTGNNPPAMQETWVRSMGHENPLEEEMSTHYSKFQGQRNLTGYSPWGCKELDMTEWLTLSLSLWKWHPKLETTKEKSDIFYYIRIINEMRNFNHIHFFIWIRFSLIFGKNRIFFFIFILKIFEFKWS